MDQQHRRLLKAFAEARQKPHVSVLRLIRLAHLSNVHASAAEKEVLSTSGWCSGCVDCDVLPARSRLESGVLEDLMEREQHRSLQTRGQHIFDECTL